MKKRLYAEERERFEISREIQKVKKEREEQAKADSNSGSSEQREPNSGGIKSNCEDQPLGDMINSGVYNNQEVPGESYQERYLVKKPRVTEEDIHPFTHELHFHLRVNKIS